jgi:hypothetical protein
MHTLRTVWRQFTKELEEAWRDITAQKWKAAFIVAAFIGIGYATDVISSLLWAMFFSFVLYRLDNRIVGVLAILCLTACPVLLALGQDAFAEYMAVFAFFFLCMTVALQLIELWREKGTEPNA